MDLLCEYKANELRDSIDKFPIHRSFKTIFKNLLGKDLYIFGKRSNDLLQLLCEKIYEKILWEDIQIS